MNLPRLKYSLLAVAAAAGTVFCPVHSQAANFTYHVDLNLASLIPDTTDAPFYLDFQLNGDGAPAGATNTVTLSNFSFTLGAASGGATTFGGAMGNFASGVTLPLDSTNSFNELYQGFTGTTTQIHFDVSSTQNGSGITPDGFLVSVLNGSLNPITTNAPDSVSLSAKPLTAR